MLDRFAYQGVISKLSRSSFSASYGTSSRSRSSAIRYRAFFRCSNYCPIVPRCQAGLVVQSSTRTTLTTCPSWVQAPNGPCRHTCRTDYPAMGVTYSLKSKPTGRVVQTGLDRQWLLSLKEEEEEVSRCCRHRNRLPRRPQTDPRSPFQTLRDAVLQDTLLQQSCFNLLAISV